MIPLISKPKLETLLNKEIIIKLSIRKGGWQKKGAIYTPDKKEYSFIFKKGEDSKKDFGMMTLEEGDLVYLWRNSYFLPNIRPSRWITCPYQSSTLEEYLSNIKR